MVFGLNEDHIQSKEEREFRGGNEIRELLGPMDIKELAFVIKEQRECKCIITT